MNKKVGKLKVSLEFLRDVYANKAIRAFLGEFIILEAFIHGNGTVEYIAESDHFEEVTNNEIPYYNVTITKTISPESTDSLSKFLYALTITKENINFQLTDIDLLKIANNIQT